jgi:TolB protein
VYRTGMLTGCLRMRLWMFPLLVLVMVALPPETFAQEDESVPEVVLEAYSTGFYRPGILYTSVLDSTFDRGQVATSNLFFERLHFAMVWSGYVNLFTKEEMGRVGPRETPGAETPEMELRVEMKRSSNGNQPLRAILRLAEIGGEPFYGGAVDLGLDDAIRKADVAAEEVLRQITGMTPPFRSRIVAVEKHPNNIKELIFLNYDGGSRWQLTRDNSIALSPSWSPDGRKIVFTSFRGGEDAELWIADLDQRKISSLLRRRGTDAAPDWSPTGEWIVFAGSLGNETHLYLIKPDGTGLRRLTRGDWIDTSPSWSPDGRRIVFMSDRSGNPQIYRMDIDGANLRRLTYDGTYNADPSWSPSGDRIVYARLGDNGFQIRSMDPMGDVDVALTDEPGDHLDPSWSPDGMKITYNYRGKVWVMSADGTLRRPLLSDGLMPDWSPIPN